MSLTRTVPAAVPSDFHNSRPVVPSVAAKNRMPFATHMPPRVQIPAPELMSLTSTVPASVPSDFQSSSPLTPSAKAKYAVPLKSTRPKKVGEAGPGMMSLTSTVPASVPSDFQSSDPWTPSWATKNRVSSTTVRNWRVAPYSAGRMSLTNTVPASVPSDFHSSSPWTRSDALKNAVPFTSTKLVGFDPPEGTVLRSATRYGSAGLTRSSSPASRGVGRRAGRSLRVSTFRSQSRRARDIDWDRRARAERAGMSGSWNGQTSSRGSGAGCITSDDRPSCQNKLVPVTTEAGM
jgi:hypothetical protein